MKIKICSTLIHPEEVKVPSSTKLGSYYLVMPSSYFHDATCQCDGFKFKGSCKHISLVESSRCQWYTKDLKTKIDTCPFCNSEVIDFETEPQWERN